MGESAAGSGTPRGPSCNTCRTRKVKCDRNRPKCLPCRRGCLKCTYSPPKSGGPHSKAHFDKASTSPIRIDLPRIPGVDDILDPIPTATTSVQDAAHSTIVVVPESIVSVSNGLVVRFQDGSSKFYSVVSLVGQVLEIEHRLQSGRGHTGPLSPPMTSTLGQPTIFEALCHDLFRSALRETPRLPVMGLYPSQTRAEQAAYTFFQKDFVQWPIYAEDSFRKSLEIFYRTPDSERCAATAIGAWYVVSEALRLELSSNPTSVAIRQSHDESLRALHAACMSYTYSPELIKPNLIDVQALTVTCIIALHQGSNEDFRKALDRACLLAKDIGLHQASPQLTEAGKLEESLWVFWGLYVFDKLSLVGGGDSCLLPSPNCGVPFPRKPAMSSLKIYHLRMARIQLAGIHEQIHTELYSVAASRRTVNQRQQSIAHISEDLQQWQASYLSSAPSLQAHTAHDMTISPALHCGVMYLHANSLCLIWRISTSQQDELKLAQAALKGCEQIVQSLKGTESNCMNHEARELFSLVNAYAATPLMVLFSIVMCASDSSIRDESQLLRQALEGIISYAETNTTVAKSSDIVETAKALSKELQRKTGVEHRASYMPSNTVSTPWVSSFLAHIVQSDHSSAGSALAKTRTPSTLNTNTEPVQASVPMPNTSDGIENLDFAPSVHSDEGYMSSLISMLPADFQTDLCAIGSSQAIQPMSEPERSLNSGYQTNTGTEMGMMAPFEQGPPADLSWAGFHLQQ